MADIRLKTEKIELGGEIFELCCNFNVLADLEYQLGGIDKLLNMPPMAAARIALAAMMTEYRDSKGKGKIYTPREVGRMLPTDKAGTVRICNLCLELIKSAVLIKEVHAGETAQAAEGADEKN